MRVLRYCLNKSITAQDITNVSYFATRHINRVFEEYFGQTFKRILNIYRLNYAKIYLVDTYYSVERIAELVGSSSAKTCTSLSRSTKA